MALLEAETTAPPVMVEKIELTNDQFQFPIYSKFQSTHSQQKSLNSGVGKSKSWLSLFLQELRQPQPPADEQGQDMNFVKNYVWIW